MNDFFEKLWYNVFMYGIYADVISAAEMVLASFEETKELLEYPEVQADKAYYLSVLSRYHNLKLIKDKLSALVSALGEEQAAAALLSEAGSDEERSAIYEEISSLQRNAVAISASLSDALGCKHLEECAYCRFKFKEISSKFGAALFALIKMDLLSHEAKITDEKIITAKGGYAQEISFTAEGIDVITRLIPLTGAHKVYVTNFKSEELCFAVTPSARIEKISEEDLKIDVFHSNGAGGQNVNKVETAVRVTHIPTGLSVVCQDERSQLQNKKRALETIQKRLKERIELSEKKRMEADIRAQYSRKNTSISFDYSNHTMTDTRLNAFTKISFPVTEEEFTSYLNRLRAL